MAWALAVAIIFSSITLFFVFMYNSLGRPREVSNEDGTTSIIDDENKFVRIALLGLAASFVLYMIGISDNILKISDVTDEALLGVMDSITVVVGAIVYMFIAYLFVYLLYYLIHKVNDTSKEMARKL